VKGGSFIGASDLTRLHFCQGKNRCSAPSSRRRQCSPALHLIFRVSLWLTKQPPRWSGCFVGASDLTRLHFCQGKNRCSAPSSRRRQCSPALHLIFRVSLWLTKQPPRWSGCFVGASDLIRLHFCQGKNRCSAPSSRRRQCSPALHLIFRVSP